MRTKQDDNGGDGCSDRMQRRPDDSDTMAQTEQQEHEGVLDANGRLTVTLPTAVDGKHEDQDYRIEARVTDAANREVSRPHDGAGHVWIVSRERGADELCVPERTAGARKGDGAGLRRQAGADAVHMGATLEKWDSVTHERTETPVASKDATTGADGTALVDLPMSGSGDFEVTASAQTPENRTVQGQTWVWIWNGAGEWYQPNAQAQIVADKKSYKVGDTAHLLLVTGLNESWAVVTAEGDTVQSRRLIHATGESFRVRCADYAAVAAEPDDQRGDCARQPVDDGAEEPESSAGGADADHYGDGQQEPISARREGQLRCVRGGLAGQAGAGGPELRRSG